MKWISQLATCFCLLFLSLSLNAQLENPLLCPSLSSIKTEGLTQSSEIVDGTLFLTYHLSHYNTGYNWAFILGPVLAKTHDAALKAGTKVLSKINGEGTVKTDEDGDLYCEFETDNSDITAFAIQADDMFSVLRKKHIHHKIQ